jgi:hypothetical protein
VPCCLSCSLSGGASSEAAAGSAGDDDGVTYDPAELTKGAPSRHLWLGNLHQRLPRSLLRSTFERFGPVEDVVTFPGRMYAFVNFREAADAAKAALAVRVSGLLFVRVVCSADYMSQVPISRELCLCMLQPRLTAVRPCMRRAPGQQQDSLAGPLSCWRLYMHLICTHADPWLTCCPSLPPLMCSCRTRKWLPSQATGAWLSSSGPAGGP